MTDPSDDDLIALDRWAVPLGEPTESTAPAVPTMPPAADEPSPELLRFPLDTEVPGDEFQPRLLRFGKAG